MYNDTTTTTTTKEFHALSCFYSHCCVWGENLSLSSLHGSDWSVTARPDSQGGGGEGRGWIWTGSLTPNARCSVLFRLNKLSPPIQKKKHTKKQTVPSRTLHPWKQSMSSVLKLYLYVLYILVTVLWLRHGFCRKATLTKKQKNQPQSSELVFFFFVFLCCPSIIPRAWHHGW